MVLLHCLVLARLIWTYSFFVVVFHCLLKIYVILYVVFANVFGITYGKAPMKLIWYWNVMSRHYWPLDEGIKPFLFSPYCGLTSQTLMYLHVYLCSHNQKFETVPNNWPVPSCFYGTKLICPKSLELHKQQRVRTEVPFSTQQNCSAYLQNTALCSMRRG